MGNSRTLMIANISPSSSSYEHTLNTLRYAFRVKGLSVASVVPSKARNAPRPFRLYAGDGAQNQQQQQQQNEQAVKTPLMDVARGKARADSALCAEQGAQRPAPVPPVCR
ncbi:putative mitotic centromere-associated kinesin (MCAK) [Trypanosoma grayi]|uniref:putative mitotic centromere-associated kinesin (MCAK) n=1 Tax=Trypanosoma grayi TaxID=71804 RepID=UPI0004F4BB97|nr:putative mitotic centromere-associated kinesin (MCAK) [Trypanosoma grayi]KEG08924.1 putative mitotic centromere-associated kinesin (MCAK) [Trypanosoma grayi]